MITPETLVTTYLEMTSFEQFNPSFVERDDVHVEQIQNPDVESYRFLYRSVGEKWRWRDRIIMPDDQLLHVISQPNTHIFVLKVADAPAGYVELVQEGDSIEVAYFGLFEDFMGMGLGKHLLSFGLQQAWQLSPNRIWVHTCNLDAPQALENYQKRGFRVYKTEEQPMPQRYTS